MDRAMDKIEDWLRGLPLQTLTDELKEDIIDEYAIALEGSIESKFIDKYYELYLEFKSDTELIKNHYK
jgi:hypothetical protein